MYEQFYGFAEKPFSLTPDPKYLYRSESHANAFEMLQYALDRREGFAVITGDIGTGKTTVCRALLGQTDDKTFTALLRNPFLSEEDLLKAILEDMGVISRSDERVAAREPSKQDLINTLYDFLLSLVPLGARAVLIIDEAQNLPLRILEQIRLLSNLETERDKLIQIILVGQLGLLKHLASPELKQLNQRVSVRYRLEALSYQETCQYIYHRLMVAGGTTGVSFAAGALRAIYDFSRGTPRLINLAADRALLQGYTDQSREITKGRALAGIRTLQDETTAPPRGRLFARWAAGVVLIAAMLAGTVAVWQFGDRWLPSGSAAPAAAAAPAPPAAAVPVFAVLVGSYPTEAEARAVAGRLAGLGYAIEVARQSSPTAAGYGVLVGRFSSQARAEEALARLVAEDGASGAQIVRAREADATP